MGQTIAMITGTVVKRRVTRPTWLMVDVTRPAHGLGVAGWRPVPACPRRRLARERRGALTTLHRPDRSSAESLAGYPPWCCLDNRDSSRTRNASSRSNTRPGRTGSSGCDPPVLTRASLTAASVGAGEPRRLAGGTVGCGPVEVFVEVRLSVSAPWLVAQSTHGRPLASGGVGRSARSAARLGASWTSRVTLTVPVGAVIRGYSRSSRSPPPCVSGCGETSAEAHHPYGARRDHLDR